MEAAKIGLINAAVPFEKLEATVRKSAEQLASIPLSQLSAMKLIVNQAYDNMGLAATQTLGPILDGLMRNTPDARSFIERAEKEGIKAVITAVISRSASTARAKDGQPNPKHVIEVKRDR